MKLESLAFDLVDGVAHVTLNQPERGNPVDLGYCTEMSRVADACQDNPEVRAILIDAAGPYFSVGGDLASLTKERDGVAEWMRNATTPINSAMARFARGNAPVVTAVHGLCCGGGVALAAAADFCLAAESSRFYAAYTGVGLACDLGVSVYLPLRVGVRDAAAFLIRNQMWSAEEAQRRGLVTEVVPDADLGTAAMDLARELAQGPTVAYGEIKKLLLTTLATPIETQLELEAQAMARCARSEDAWHGMTEVAARRKPTFSGH